MVDLAPREDEMISELTAVEEWRSEKEDAGMAAPSDGSKADRYWALLIE